MRRTNFDPMPHEEVAKAWLSWVKWKSDPNKTAAWEYSETLRDAFWSSLTNEELIVTEMTLVIVDIVPDTSGQGLWVIRERQHMYLHYDTEHHKFVYLHDPIPMREALILNNNRLLLNEYIKKQKQII
jgi:hypothetical protein